MCLDSTHDKYDKELWLEDRPRVITAWKVVRVGNVEGTDGEHLYPLYQGNTPFKRKNHLREIKVEKSDKIVALGRSDKVRNTKDTYVAYYHLCTNYEQLDYEFSYEKQSFIKIIECRVPKKYVTDVGRQWSMETIVTRQFSIVGQDEYLKD